jgi:hypothetical protein
VQAGKGRNPKPQGTVPVHSKQTPTPINGYRGLVHYWSSWPSHGHARTQLAYLYRAGTFVVSHDLQCGYEVVTEQTHLPDIGQNVRHSPVIVKLYAPDSAGSHGVWNAAKGFQSHSGISPFVQS